MKHQMRSTYWKNVITFPDKVLISLIVFGVASACVLFAFNRYDFHFTTVQLFSDQMPTLSWVDMISAIFLALFFVFYAMIIRKELPRSAVFLRGIGLLFLAALVNIVLCNALQATPFSPIDHILLKIDQKMGINTAALMAWTYSRPDIHTLFNHIYQYLIFELIPLPILFSLCASWQTISIFYIAELSSLFVGGAIYYFLPTMAPSGIIHSPYFSAAQRDTSMRFYEVHHFLTVATAQGGLIAFPSFHVIWAILLTYCCKSSKLIFYPLLCFNVILIISTVMLGWHYICDVIAAFVLVTGAIGFAKWVVRKGEEREGLFHDLQTEP